MPKKFVIHEHHATNLHFDLRLEVEGVLVSWAVPKGLSLVPYENRLAIRVSDHKLSYLNFQGTRRKGLRGAGEVCIWDIGEFEADCNRLDRIDQELSTVKFYGNVVRGKFALQKWSHSSDKWSIIKIDDEFADRSFKLKTVLTPLNGRKHPLFTFTGGYDPLFDCR
jgi:DNA ligase D-like protein (predicted 3'-phosphoesterase)